MSVNETNMYDVDARIAEIYDQVETQTDDVALVRRLIRGREALRAGRGAAWHGHPARVSQGRLGPAGASGTAKMAVGHMGETPVPRSPAIAQPARALRILEPFCGAGRMLIPLASDGHELVGMDQSRAMLDSARAKLADLPADTRRRVTLTQADVTAAPWPGGFDLVILGANCFYELATADEQERCIAAAAAALRPGGHLFLDNNHMEGDLDEAWRRPGETEGFPTGTCADGTRLEGRAETIWYDAPARLARFRRSVTVTYPDGTTRRREWIQQKHPPSTAEMRQWLTRHGFEVEGLYGDRAGGAYSPQSGRAIFWARAAGTP